MDPAQGIGDPTDGLGTVNRLVRRKLRLSLLLLGTYVVLHFALALRPSLGELLDEKFLSIERLAFAAI